MQFVNIVLVILNLGIVISAPNHVKVVKTLESNEIPSVSVGAGGVSASWGGYSAKAGLGGNTGVAGGLYASADSPHGNAAAGLGGNVGDSISGGLGASASSPYGGSANAGLGGNTNSGTTYVKEVTVQGGSSANSHSSAGDSNTAGSGSYASSGASAGSSSTGSHTQVVYNSNNKPGGLFDNIFNIPISVLQAVNGLLNQQHGGAQVTKTVRVRGHGHHGHRRTQIDNRNAFSQSESSANANTYESHPAPAPGPVPALPPPEHPVSVGSSHGASGSAGATVTIQKAPVNYDNIFNIPISALRAVNKLLNDGAASISKNVQVQGSAHVSHRHTGGAQIAHGHSNGANVAHGHAGNVEITNTHVVPSNVATAAGSADLHVQVGHHGTLESSQPQALTSAAYTAQKPAGFYDNIFNIPITALKSVNQLLNG